MYNQYKFNCTRGNVNCEALAVPGTAHFYVNLEDTVFGSGINNITDPGYFPENFGFRPDQVQVNDLVFFRGADGTAWALITSVSPTVMTSLYPNVPVPAQAVINTTASGPWASPGATTLRLLSVDKQVTLTCTNPIQATAVNTAPIQFAAGVLNVAGYIPRFNTIDYVILGVNNSVNSAINVELSTSGDILITHLGLNFTNSGLAGFYRFCISYQAQ